jgi:hypothetical protein
VLALESLHGLRVVASPEALDGARWEGTDVVVLRFAPDDAFALGARGVDVDDEHAIVEPEAGFVGAWLDAEALVGEVVPHIEWPLPVDRPILAQGTIAGVPAKLWLTLDAGGADRALLVALAAHAEELGGRLR